MEQETDDFARMNKTEKVLTGLLDYQRFEKNEELEDLIEETNSRCDRNELSDEELEIVAAAAGVSKRIGKEGRKTNGKQHG